MMEAHDFEVTWVHIRDVKPHAKNARKHPRAQVERLAAMIREFKFSSPIDVDVHGVIIRGHGRLAAAKHLKLTHVPVIVRDDLNEEQVRAFRVADNTIALDSEWDFPALVDEVAELAGMGTGLLCDFVDVQKLLASEENLPELDEPKADGETKGAKSCPHCGGEL